MTWPTNQPISFSLPDLNFSTCFGLSAITRATMASMAPWSEICSRPLSATISAADLPLAHIASKTSLAMRPEIVSAAIRSSKPPSLSASTGASASATSERLSAAKYAPVSQLAASLGSRPPESPVITRS